MFTTDHPFIEPGLFADRNFIVGLMFIFVVGTTLYATLALLPPFMQHLMGFPVITTGYVLAPRGMGTMVAMFLVGRLIGRVDTRLLIFSGLAFTALALGTMSSFTVDVSRTTLVWTGILQGLGFGFVFVPLSTITFVTLPSRFRTEGTAMYSLMRNIGSSIGISVVVTLLARNTQINHASLAANLNPFRLALLAVSLPKSLDWTTTAGRIALDAEVTRQAATIGYLNDFTLVMWLTLVAIPLIFLFKSPVKR